MNKPKIGISIGDLNGISVEVIMKTFMDKRMFDHCIPIVYGSTKALSYHKKVLGYDDFQYNSLSDAVKAREGVLNVINCWEEVVPIKVGTPDNAMGQYSLKALEAVAYDAIEGKIDAIVTAPVNKNNINTKENPFLGQTEFFAKKCDSKESLMFLVSDKLKVGLVTNHIPVSQVAGKITSDLILKKIKTINQSLCQDYLMDKPKIGVLALNPHAGDNGLIGKEDDEIVTPAVAQAKKDGIMAFGPFSADGFFGSNLYRQFDAVLAMYHDQGLIPFKLLGFGEGVNFTAGLPIVRTSPDHGTAYDIAGQGIADHHSFQKSIFKAIDIIKNRNNYTEMHANSLKKVELERDRSESREQ